MRRRSFVAAPSRGARRDLSQAGLRRVKRASGAAAYRPSGSAAQTAFSYPVRGARTARVVCRGDGEWARREGPSAGDGCSAAGSGRRQAKSGSERRIGGGRAAGGHRSRGGCAAENRQSSARKALFCPPAEAQKASAVLPARGKTLLLFSRRCAKRFRRSPQESVAERADCMKRQAVGCAASLYGCLSAAVWEAARIFAGAKIL